MPHAAIIVPTFSRPERLAACLAALCAQTHGDYEIVVVDDGSPDPVARHFPDLPEKVRFLRQENRGPAAARNTGVASTDASFLAFTDDDCRPDPDWLDHLIRAHDDHPARLVGGRVLNGLPDNRFSAASQSLCDFLYAHFDAAGGTMPFFTSNNIACSRATFESYGRFDETFPRAAAEDREFGLRWRERGGDLVFAPEAVIHHYHAMTFRQFWRQHRNYGFGAAHLHKVLSARGADVPRREPLSFYRDLVLWPVRARGWRGVPAIPLMLVTQLAMVSGVASGRGAATAA